MKDLITTMASLLIFMLFFMQFATNQMTYTKVMGAEFAIKQFRILTQAQGYFSEDNRQDLEQKLSELLDCERGEIKLQLEQSKNHVGTYRVEMPLKGLIGPWRLLGLSQIENQRPLIMEGVVELESLSEEEKDT